MKLATREDISAPIEMVFQQLSDFDGFERAALRRGAEIVRTDALPAVGVGMTWRAQFDFRGRERTANLELTEYDAPNGMKLVTHSSGAEIEMVMELVAMSRQRTRMNVSVDIRPKSLSARVMIQSMKLARSNVLKRYRKAIAEFARTVEDRCKDHMV